MKVEFQTSSTYRRDNILVELDPQNNPGKLASTGAVIVQYATNNCQLHVIQQAASLVAHKHARAIFNGVISKLSWGGKLLLMDVNEVYAPYVEKLFNKKYVVKSPYESTNNSKMVVYIVRSADLIQSDETLK